MIPLTLEEREAAIAAMTKFYSGHWTRERPTEPGKYLVRGVGYEYEEHNDWWLLVRLPDGELRAPHPWSGWFWSEPVPPSLALPGFNP